ncbi:MAG: hypothetical protein PHY39_07160 [Endomicrobiaceae bacterium]|nr:hypothetical protein [Endomicrobiaceae bacterium]
MAQYITTNIIQRVLFVKYGSSIASSFTIEIDDRQYLISAKHVFPKIKSEDIIQIFKDGAWKNLKVEPIFCEDKEIDIVAFNLPNNKIITPKHKIDNGIGGVKYAQDAFFLGYPYGLHSDSGEINNNYPFPFIKKCIISAIEKKIIYLDGHNNRGFSGGPVVILKNDTSNDLQIIGVVNSFINDTVNKEENSGLFVASIINPIIDAIKKNKIILAKINKIQT